jgi:hypothetical protein
MQDLSSMIRQPKSVSLIYSPKRESNTRVTVPLSLHIALGQDSLGVKRTTTMPVLYLALVDFGIVALKLSSLMKKSEEAFSTTQYRLSRFPLLLMENKSVDDFIEEAQRLNFNNGVLVISTLNTALHYSGSKDYSISKYLPIAIRNLLLIKETLNSSIVLTMTGSHVSPKLYDFVDTVVKVSANGHQIEKGSNQAQLYKLMSN